MLTANDVVKWDIVKDFVALQSSSKGIACPKEDKAKVLVDEDSSDSDCVSTLVCLGIYNAV